MFQAYFEEQYTYDIAVRGVDLEEEDGELIVEVFDHMGDLGTEKQATKSAEVMSQELQFKGERPFLFNKTKYCSSAFTLWDNEGEIASEEQEELRLHWVQLAGISAMVEKSFSDVEATDLPGILLADEVGVGKSAQIMGFIAFLLQVKYMETSNASQPQVVSKCPLCLFTNQIDLHSF
jgi:hypothetical protein